MSGWLESTAAAPSTSRTAASMVALPALASQGSLRMGVSCTQQASLQLSQQPSSSRCLPLTSEPSTAQTFIFH